MGIITSQQLTQYYNQYRDVEITFSKDVIRTLSIDPRQIYIKCNGSQWPCILNSTSFLLSKIIIGSKGGAFIQLSKKDPPPVNIRYCFYEQGGQLSSFLVTGKVTALSSYGNSGDLVIATITFTQRPPDALIEMTGRLIETNDNSIRRKDERIVLNEDAKRKLGIPKEEIRIAVQGVPRNCILRELSFAGAKVMLMGLVQFLVNRDVVLEVPFEDPPENILIKGKITQATPIEGRKDIVAATIVYNQGAVPMSYKLHINDFITTVKKRPVSVVQQTAIDTSTVSTATQTTQPAPAV